MNTKTQFKSMCNIVTINQEKTYYPHNKYNIIDGHR